MGQVNSNLEIKSPSKKTLNLFERVCHLNILFSQSLLEILIRILDDLLYNNIDCLEF